jgi:hypothetical protein
MGFIVFITHSIIFLQTNSTSYEQSESKKNLRQKYLNFQTLEKVRYCLLRFQASRHSRQVPSIRYTIDLLAADINTGLVQLVLEKQNSTLELIIHTSDDESLIRLSEALRTHPPRYEDNDLDELNNTNFMKAVYNKSNATQVHMFESILKSIYLLNIFGFDFLANFDIRKQSNGDFIVR